MLRMVIDIEVASDVGQSRLAPSSRGVNPSRCQICRSARNGYRPGENGVVEILKARRFICAKLAEEGFGLIGRSPSP